LGGRCTSEHLRLIENKVVVRLAPKPDRKLVLDGRGGGRQGVSTGANAAGNGVIHDSLRDSGLEMRQTGGTAHRRCPSPRLFSPLPQIAAKLSERLALTLRPREAGA